MKNQIDNDTLLDAAINQLYDECYDEFKNIKGQSVRVHVDAIFDSLNIFNLDSINKNISDTKIQIEKYKTFKKDTRELIADQQLNSRQSRTRNPNVSRNVIKVQDAFRIADKVVKKVEDFINSKYSVNIPKLNINVNLKKLIESNKNFKRKSIGGKTALGALSYLTGSAFPMMIPELLKESKEFMSELKQNDKAGRYKTAGAAALKGLGFLTGSAGLITVGSHLSQSAKGNLQRKITSENMVKKVNERIKKTLDETNIDVTNPRFSFAKGGLVDIKGGRNSMLGGARVNENGQEQAIIVPAGKNPLEDISMKLSVTNNHLNNLVKSSYATLDFQEDQARLAALAEKDNKITGTSFNTKSLLDFKKDKLVDGHGLMGMFTQSAIGTIVGSVISSIGVGTIMSAGAAMALSGALALGFAGVMGIIKRGANNGVGMPLPELKKGETSTIGQKPSQSEINKWNEGLTTKPTRKSPTGSLSNPLYVVNDDRKKKKSTDDIQAAKLQTKAFTTMNDYFSEKDGMKPEEMATAKADESIIDKISAFFGNKVQPFISGEPAAKFDISRLQSGVGSVAAMFESNSSAGRISSGKGDAGGKSYGTFQLSSARGQVDEFLKSSGYASKFAGKQVGSAEFDQQWRNLASNDPNFAKAQQSFIGKTHAAPQLAKLEKLGLDVNNRAIQEMAFSTGVQYGPNSNIIENALKSSGKNPRSLSVPEIISIVQNYKASTTASEFRSSSPTVQKSVAIRHGRDEKAALLEVANISPSPYKKLVPEKNVKTIKNNSLMVSQSSEANSLKNKETAVDVAINKKQNDNTQKAINNININKGGEIRSPQKTIITGDTVSFVSRVTRTY